MLDLWNSPVGSGVASGLIVVAVTAVASRLPKVGPRIRGVLRAAGSFLWSLRPTTQRHLELRRSQWQETELVLLDTMRTQHEVEKAKLERRIAFISEDSALDLKNLESELATEREQTKALRENLAKSDAGSAEAFALARKWENEAQRLDAEVGTLRKELTAKAKREAAARPRPDPSQGSPRSTAQLGRGIAALLDVGSESKTTDYVPDPHWRIFEDPGQPDLWVIGSAISESRGQRVRLEADRRTFDLAEGGYWPEISGGFKGQQKSFRGRATRWGLDHGILFIVRWINPLTGAERSEEVRGVVGDVPI